MAAKNGKKMIFEKNPKTSLRIPRGVKKFVKIALSCTVSEIYALLHFTQKFKMAAKNGWKTIFYEKSPVKN